MVDGRVERFIFPNVTDKSYSDVTGLKVRKVKKKSIIKGPVTFFHDYDDSCIVNPQN